MKVRLPVLNGAIRSITRVIRDESGAIVDLSTSIYPPRGPVKDNIEEVRKAFPYLEIMK